MRDTIGPARDLEADIAICEAATAGPWEAQISQSGSEVVTGDDSSTWVCQLWYKDEDIMQNHKSNARFIAEAREGWPYAIQRALAAEARVAELERELKRLKGGECSCPGSA